MVASMNQDDVVIDLRLIRKMSGKSMREMADQMGFGSANGPSTLNRMEMRNDWLVSRLIAYIRAAGGAGALVIQLGDEELIFNLTD